MSVNIIVACDSNNGIGKQGSIPWKSDLKYFKEKTMGSVIIMGKETMKSLPFFPLPGRVNIVVSTTLDDGRFAVEKKSGEKAFFYSCKSLSYAITVAKTHAADKDIYIIGGTQLYRAALEQGLVDKIFLTRYHEEYGCDRFFPELKGDWTGLHEFFPEEKCTRTELIPTEVYLSKMRLSSEL